MRNQTQLQLASMRRRESSSRGLVENMWRCEERREVSRNRSSRRFELSEKAKSDLAAFAVIMALGIEFLACFTHWLITG